MRRICLYLLKREQAHKEFLEDIVPFEENVAEGVQHKEIVEESIKVGRQLLGALEHLKQSEEETLETLQKEIEKLQERQAELRFQKDNLEYAKAHRDVLDWEKKLAEEKKKHTTLEESVAGKTGTKRQAGFSIIIERVV